MKKGSQSYLDQEALVFLGEVFVTRLLGGRIEEVIP